MALFGKRKETTETKSTSSSCCGVGCDCGRMAQAESAKTEGASVKVLGSGCQKCNALEAATKAALEQLRAFGACGEAAAAAGDEVGDGRLRPGAIRGKRVSVTAAPVIAVPSDVRGERLQLVNGDAAVSHWGQPVTKAARDLGQDRRGPRTLRVRQRNVGLAAGFLFGEDGAGAPAGVFGAGHKSLPGMDREHPAVVAEGAGRVSCGGETGMKLFVTGGALLAVGVSAGLWFAAAALLFFVLALLRSFI